VLIERSRFIDDLKVLNDGTWQMNRLRRGRGRRNLLQDGVFVVVYIVVVVNRRRKKNRRRRWRGRGLVLIESCGLLYDLVVLDDGSWQVDGLWWGRRWRNLL